MNDDLLKLIKQLVAIIGNDVDVGHDASVSVHGGHGECNCHCGCNCQSCTTVLQYEASAARFNDQSSNAAAMAQQNFVAQQASMQAQLLKLQSEITVGPLE
jgi:hypothetical protein